MLVQYMSDVHLEFGQLVLTNPLDAKVLILAGDICVADDIDRNLPEDFDPTEAGAIDKLGARQQAAMRYREFFKQANDMFEHVLVIAGNHEFYHGKWVKSLEIMREEYARYPNFHFMERECYVIEDVTFIGSTLWTDMNKGDPHTLHAVTDMMNDFRIIRNDDMGFTKLRPARTLPRHRDSLGYIGEVVREKPDQKFVVISHHAPSFKSVHPYYGDQRLMNGAYASDLSEFILDRPQIKYWIHGHMHDPVDYFIGDTHVLSNPRGYVGEHRTQAFAPRYFDV